MNDEQKKKESTAVVVVLVAVACMIMVATGVSVAGMMASEFTPGAVVFQVIMDAVVQIALLVGIASAVRLSAM